MQNGLNHSINWLKTHWKYLNWLKHRLLILFSFFFKKKLFETNSKVTHNRSPSYLYGHDWLLSNNGPTTRSSTALNVEIWPCGSEESPFPWSDERRESKMKFNQSRHSLFWVCFFSNHLSFVVRLFKYHVLENIILERFSYLSVWSTRQQALWFSGVGVWSIVIHEPCSI